MKLEMVPMQTSYSVSLPPNGLAAIEDAEGFPNHPYAVDNGTLLDQLLGIYGVNDVEYSGLLGNFVFFKLDADGETAKIHKAILKVIGDYLDAIM